MTVDGLHDSFQFFNISYIASSGQTLIGKSSLIHIFASFVQFFKLLTNMDNHKVGIKGCVEIEPKTAMDQLLK